MFTESKRYSEKQQYGRSRTAYKTQRIFVRIRETLSLYSRYNQGPFPIRNVLDDASKGSVGLHDRFQGETPGQLHRPGIKSSQIQARGFRMISSRYGRHALSHRRPLFMRCAFKPFSQPVQGQGPARPAKPPRFTILPRSPRYIEI